MPRCLFAFLLFLWVPVGAAAQANEAAAAPQIAFPAGKLPTTATPLAYRIDLTLDAAKERFSGKVEIDATLARPSKIVFLHGRNLAMQRAVAVVGGKSFSAVWQQGDPTGVAALTFSDPLPAGRVTFAFDYGAPFSDGPSGLFRVKVGEDWYSWSQFQSIDARAAFPAFDEPGFKTPFTVTLRTRPGVTAISNGPLASQTSEGGFDVHRFAPTLPLPTYLVAMMTGPFASVAASVPTSPQRAVPLPLRVLSPQPNRAKLDFALEGSKGIVLRLEDYFGDAFPYPKLDQISTPVLPGAMENAGANLYGDNILIVDAKASVARQRQFGMIVAHELAHQWFGDLVTPKWWDDIWLNESFANWLGYRMAAEWRPDLKIAGGVLAEGFAAMDTDSLVAGRPIRQPIVTNSQIDSSFDAITYGKGGHVVAMIAGYMGDEKFRDGVRRYMAVHRYGSASSDDFFAALASAAGDPRLIDAMRSFTDQQGVPLLTFTQRGDNFAVSQLRYTALGSAPGNARWTVPLCVRRGAARQCRLMTEKSEGFFLAGKDPLMPNADGLGYYRFELPSRTWDQLIKQADHLPGGEAYALADSLKASFRTGRATPRQLVALTRKLVNNSDSHASAAAGILLDALTSSELIDAGSVVAFRRLISQLYAPLLRKTVFDPRMGAAMGEDADLSQRRSVAIVRLTNWARDRKLRRVLADAAAAFLDGDKGALDPQWFDLGFDAILERGGLPQAKIIGDAALASQDADLRPAILDSLASSGNNSIATWLLNEWKDERLRPSERRFLLLGIMGSRATRDSGYRWLRNNLDAVTAGNDGIFFAARLPQMLGGFCSADRAREFETELRPRFGGKPGALELERAIERVRNCAVVRDTLALSVAEEFAKGR